MKSNESLEDIPAQELLSKLRMHSNDMALMIMNHIPCVKTSAF